jgi:hypothetical protein
MIVSDFEGFCSAPSQTLPFPALKISDTFRIKTGYGQNEETRREGERELKTPPAQMTVRVQKVSPRLPPMRMLKLSTTKVVLLIIMAILLRFGLASQTINAQPQHISNRGNGEVILATEGSMQAAHRRASTRHRQDRKKERKNALTSRSLCTQPKVVGKNLASVQCAPNPNACHIPHTDHEDCWKSPIVKSTSVKGQMTEKDANTSKYCDMPRAEISPRSASYLVLAQDGRDLAVELLQEKWPKEAEGVLDQICYQGQRRKSDGNTQPGKDHLCASWSHD